jgi:hypothetical protein
VAIALDTANHGTVAAAASASTIAVTTTSVVAASRRITIFAGWFGTATISSVADDGPGLTWVVDAQAAPSTDRHAAWISADAPSGLASGTTITITLSAGNTDRAAQVSSWSGMETGATGYTGVTGSQTTTTPNWSSGARSIAAGSMLCVALHEDSSGNDTANASAGTTVLGNLDPSVDDIAAGYRIEASAGSYAAAGTWSSASSDTSNVYVEYIEDAGGAAPTVKNLASLGVG